MTEVYYIGGNALIGSPTAAIIGGKAMSLCVMTKMGLPVPPAIVIPCKTTFEYKKDPIGTIQVLKAQVISGLACIEDQVDRQCLFSVRSGAPISMPGMMDTILNVGLNVKTGPQLLSFMSMAAVSDSAKRLNEMFKIAEPYAPKKPVTEISVIDQVMACVEAVFASWDSDRAVEYRKINKISDDLGTAVTIQAMVYGNLDDKSGSGVLFTRDPSTGEKKIMAEYLVNAQGEDVVAGTHTPINPFDYYDSGSPEASWLGPLVADVVPALENHYHDMVDVEFTVESGKLYILQSRKGKRTPKAAVKIATDLMREGVIGPDDLRDYLTVKQVCEATQNVITHSGHAHLIGTGLPAGGGVVKGKAALTIEQAIKQSQSGPVILVRDETLPEDIKGMYAATGIVTLKGGATSHAAVVSRSMNKTCVVGLHPNDPWACAAGDRLVVDGETGNVWYDPDDTMKIELGSETLVEELAAEIANRKNLQLVTLQVKLTKRPVVRIADMLFDNSVIAIDCKDWDGTVVVDARGVDAFMHDDDKGVWDMLAPLTEIEIDNTFQEVINGLDGANVDSVVLSAPADYKGKKVIQAKTVYDVFCGEPVMIDIGFIKRVIGSKDMYNQLVKQFGEPNKFGTTTTVYEAVMSCLV